MPYIGLCGLVLVSFCDSAGISVPVTLANAAVLVKVDLMPRSCALAALHSPQHVRAHDIGAARKVEADKGDHPRTLRDAATGHRGRNIRRELRVGDFWIRQQRRQRRKYHGGAACHEALRDEFPARGRPRMIRMTERLAPSQTFGYFAELRYVAHSHN